MGAMYNFTIDRSLKTPAYRQLYFQISECIEKGKILSGEKLPKIRELASNLGIARNTVEAAYKQLALEGYAKGHRGIGYVVEDLDLSVFDGNASGRSDSALIEASENVRNIFPLGSDLGCKYDFAYGNKDLGALPIDIMRAMADKAFRANNFESASLYMDPFGLYGLRKEIAKYVYKKRDIRCVPEQVVIQSGTQAALRKLASLFSERDACVAVEDPGYSIARDAFVEEGYKIEPLPVHMDEANVIERLQNSDAKLAVVTPSNQFPLGFVMSLSMRLKLIDWARKKDAYIIEDDYCCEFRYESSPSPALRAIDKDNTIYLGTMSKILTPAIRISYIILPAALLERWNKRFPSDLCAVPWLEQEMLRLFLESNTWDRYERSTVNTYRKRHDILARSLKSEMGDLVDVLDEGAGLHLLVVDKYERTQEELIELARRKNVRVYPTEQYWTTDPHPMKSSILIGFSKITEEEIPKGIKQLAKAWSL